MAQTATPLTSVPNSTPVSAPVSTPVSAPVPTPTQTPEVIKKPEVVSAPVVDTALKPERGPSFTIHSNINVIRHLKALIYGDYGAGKTFLTGTAAEVEYMRDILFISTDVGELTLYDPTSKYNFSLIDIISVKSYDTLSRVHEFLRVHCSLRDRIINSKNQDKEAIRQLTTLQARMMPGIPDPGRLRLYRTVVLDSLAESENQCMMQLLGVTAETDIHEEVQPEEWGEYRKQRNMIHRLLRNMRNLPMNVLFTCPRTFRKNENTKREVYMPAMTGQLRQDVQGFVDLVGHLVVGDLKTVKATAEVGEAVKEEEDPDVVIPRRLYIQPGPRHAAKSRFTVYKKAFFDEPTMLSITTAVGLFDTWQMIYKDTTD